MKDLEKYIEEQLSEIDVKEIVVREVKDAVHNEIKAEVKRSIASWTKEKAEKLIETEIEIALTRPVHTDDGWGKREEYGNFEELFKKVFYSKLNNSWEMKKTIKKSVEEKVQDLYSESGSKFMDAFKEFLDKDAIS